MSRVKSCVSLHPFPLFIVIPTQTSLSRLPLFKSASIDPPGPHFSPFPPKLLSTNGWEICSLTVAKHCCIQVALKVWHPAPQLTYLVICENRYKVHSLLSGTFERSSGKMFSGIIFECGGSEASKGLLTQGLQSTRVNILAGRGVQKLCPWELSWETLGCSTDIGPQCILGQCGRSNLAESFYFLS